jgi:integrase
VKGHVEKFRDGYKVVIESGQDAAGKRKRNVYFRRKKKDADAKLIEELDNIDEGTFVERSDKTVAQFFLTDWLAANSSKVRLNTHDSYRTIVVSYVLPHLGNVKLQELTAPAVERWLSKLAKEGKRGRRPLSGRTCRYAFVVLRRALADAVRWNLVPRNVTDQVKAPKEKSRPRTFWTPKETARFLAHVREHPLYAAYLLAATCGPRRSEILGLPKRAVDLKAGTLSIERTLVLVGREVVFSEPKSDKARRQIRLGTETVSALRSHLARQAQERLALGAAYTDLDLVFCDEAGEPLHPEAFSASFRRLVKETGLPRMGIHGLRHSHASHLLKAGQHPKVVMERLGHHSIAVTMDTYSHLLEGMQETAAAKAEALIFGG